ncbi:hypothetical protein OH146_02975 [Salinibacterium sp. SYSU T00001]|uniref:DUF6993 domain-containing protein n=1 Tax=Homoserinimonas sedimenticola TaxID=2986805 RepID=UPI0022366009|nr:hypothetical protein [Salinibacterium sedimenticola]MCW4384732.1 hypothetical protein [Salinibacterium sedimenticola]
MKQRTTLRATAVAGALALLLGGCSATVEEPTPSPSGAPVIAPTALPQTPPELVPEGTADENRPYFDYVVARHIVDDGTMNHGSVAALLTSAGWESSAIEVTADATPLGNPTDALSFAVQVGDECLIGQWNGEYTSVVAPRLSSGTCLVGTPRPVG